MKMHTSAIELLCHGSNKDKTWKMGISSACRKEHRDMGGTISGIPIRLEGNGDIGVSHRVPQPPRQPKQYPHTTSPAHTHDFDIECTPIQLTRQDSVGSKNIRRIFPCLTGYEQRSLSKRA